MNRESLEESAGGGTEVSEYPVRRGVRAALPMLLVALLALLVPGCRVMESGGPQDVPPPV
jgi:hypothetical protein